MNVIFDIDDTLYDLKQPFDQAFAKLWQGKYPVDAGRLFALTRTYNNQMFDQYLRGEAQIGDIGVWRLRKAMQALGFAVSEAEAEAFQAVYRDFQYQIRLSEELIRLLDGLKRGGAALGVLTNGESDHQRSKARALGLERWIPAQQIFVSAEIGAAKPDVRAFAIVEERLGLRKEETWYVGDSVTHDLVGARRAGWHMILLNRRGQDWHSVPEQPDAVVQTEGELRGYLEELLAGSQSEH